jgi:hypothetical protein
MTEEISPERARQILRDNGYEVPSPSKNSRTLPGELFRSAATGAASIADPLAFVANVPSYLTSYALGKPVEEAVYYPSELVRSGLEKLSGVEGQEYSPAQKVAKTTSEFLGSGIGAKGALAARALSKNLINRLPSTGGTSKTKLMELLAPTNAKDWSSLGLAGFGSGALPQLFPEEEGLASIAGGVLGGNLQNAKRYLNPKNIVKDSITSVTKVDPKVYEEFIAQGIQPNLAEITTSKPIKTLHNLLCFLLLHV